MRATMLRDDPSPMCQGCYSLEAVGSPSPRNSANRFFASDAGLLDQTLPDGSITNPLRSLDLGFSNLCNHKCRICGPHNSTSWIADAQALGTKGPLHIQHLFHSSRGFKDELRSIIPELKLLYFAGGEPLLDDSHYEFLETVLELGRSDIVLDYNSNLSVLACGKREIIPLWKKFQTVQIGASVDGAGAQYEYLRKRASWKTLLANFGRLRSEVPGIRIHINASISALNVFHLPEAIMEWLREELIQWPDQLLLNFVSNPAYFAVGILNEKERDALARHYAEAEAAIPSSTNLAVRWSVQRALQTVLKTVVNQPYSPATEPLRRELREELLAVDRIRGENFEALFPELESLVRDDESAEVVVKRPASENMKVEMPNGLTTVFAGIDDRAETSGQ